MNLEILLGFVVSTGLLALSPGPDNIYVLTQSMAHGRNHGLATTAGLMTGCLVHTTLLAFGLSVVFRENPTIALAVRIFGACYLLFLAYQVFKSDPAIRITEEKESGKSLWQLFRQGFIMNVLNPKVALFFLAFFPGFLFSDNLSLVLQFYVLGAIFILVSFLVFGGIAFLSDLIANSLSKNTSLGIYLKWLQIIVFCGLALYLLLSGN